MTAQACGTCGRSVDEHDRHVRFLLPEPVLDVPEEERAARTWGDDELLQVQGVGCFVRVLLPIVLSGGHSLTLGTWLLVDPDRFPEACRAWADPAAYRALGLDGYLGNRIPPWGSELLGAAAHAVVRRPDQVPWVQASDDALLAHVLHATWPHEDLLEIYATLG